MLEAIQEDFTPHVYLDYGKARDTMFLLIDSKDRILECIYTGLKIEIPEGEDPTQAVYLNGIRDGINTEHSYPQSKGADREPAESNMHHLFPTRVGTNGDRGNHIFGEVPDNQTSKWYRENVEMTTKPSSLIDEYSEFRSGANPLFEPRESKKGDIARAIFYFFSIYRAEAVAADPAYFESMREDLCKWHEEDPVDETEWVRSFKIAHYQDNKANPFVMDCSLAARLYCTTISEACDLLLDSKELNDFADFYVFPNPVLEDQTFIHLQINTVLTGEVRVEMYDFTGRLIQSTKLNLENQGVQNIGLPIESGKGSFLIRLMDESTGRFVQKIFIKL